VIVVAPKLSEFVRFIGQLVELTKHTINPALQLIAYPPLVARELAPALALHCCLSRFIGGEGVSVRKPIVIECALPASARLLPIPWLRRDDHRTVCLLRG
jgi:hypothetical protein